MKKFKSELYCFILLILSFSIGSCFYALTAEPDTINYRPGIDLKGSGNVAVSEIIYKHGEGIRPNQIKNTTFGWIHFDVNINDYVKDALIKELSYIGYSLDPSSKIKIDGVIEELKINDFGFNVTYKAKLTFNINEDSNLIYSKLVSSEIKAPKNGIYKKPINDLLRDCIEKFIVDAQMKKVL